MITKGGGGRSQKVVINRQESGGEAEKVSLDGWLVKWCAVRYRVDEEIPKGG